MIKILNEKPPIYDAVVAAGLRFNPATVLFAYDDAIYNPSGQEVPEDIIAHEAVHLQQQAECGGAEAWWQRYLSDPYFRIQQEVEAYATQYAFICNYIVRDRNRQVHVLISLSRALSGPLYGSMISRSEAEKMIRGQLQVNRVPK